jgi:hypothetical protein
VWVTQQHDSKSHYFLTKMKGKEYSLAVELLASMLKALGCIPSTFKKFQL